MSGHMSTGNRVSRTGPCITTARMGHSDFDRGQRGRGGQRGQDATARRRLPAPLRSVVSTNPKITLSAAGRLEVRVGRPVNPIGHVPIHC
jgi:hypothetical protein